jgi:hypothetical protein
VVLVQLVETCVCKAAPGRQEQAVLCQLWLVMDQAAQKGRLLIFAGAEALRLMVLEVLFRLLLAMFCLGLVAEQLFLEERL